MLAGAGDTQAICHTIHYSALLRTPCRLSFRSSSPLASLRHIPALTCRPWLGCLSSRRITKEQGIAGFPETIRWRRSSRRSSSSALSTARRGESVSDPELRVVLELATDAELVELDRILFGPSYFSPLLKSISRKPVSDCKMEVNGIEERDIFISRLESRFLFLAADARSIIRGQRPSYRSVLLAVRKKLGIPCSNKLSSEDIEAEIFLYLLKEFSRELGCLNDELSKWKVLSGAALKVGSKGFQNMFLKGGLIFAVEKIQELLAKRLSGKFLLEFANYEIKSEIIKQGGTLAAINIESRAGLLAASQGLARAASRYLGLKSLMTFLGPLMWGTFLADVVIQMLGTDYARILEAIHTFAQIRLTRIYGATSNEG